MKLLVSLNLFNFSFSAYHRDMITALKSEIERLESQLEDVSNNL